MFRGVLLFFFLCVCVFCVCLIGCFRVFFVVSCLFVFEFLCWCRALGCVCRKFIAWCFRL